MKTHNFDVTRNGVTVRILVEADSAHEAEGMVFKFLSHHESSVKYLGIFGEEHIDTADLRKLIQISNVVYVNNTIIKNRYGTDEKFNGLSFITNYDNFELVSWSGDTKVLFLKTKQ